MTRYNFGSLKINAYLWGNIKGNAMKWYKNWKHKCKVRKTLKLHSSESKTYKVWEHSGWGDSIILDANFGVSGHLFTRPKVGDRLEYKTQSGKVAYGIFTNVEYCRDPHDMFFGNIQPIAYID